MLTERSLMSTEEIARVRIEDVGTVMAFERLESIECELGADEEILQRERETAWDILRTAYPELVIDACAYYDYTTHELVIWN